MMLRNFAFVMLACLSIRIACGYKVTIGRSPNADLVVTGAYTDVYSIAQKALQNISAHNGGVLAFETGVYMFSANLRVPSGITIVGQGIENTTLKLATSAKASNSSAFIHIDKASRVALQGLTLDGSKQQNISHAISITDSTECFMTSIQVQSFLGNGVTVARVDTISLTSSFIRDNAASGISIVDSSNVVLRNNTVLKSGNHGIFVERSKVTDFSNNTVNNHGKESNGCGITFQSLEIKATNNVVLGYSKVGVCISSSKVFLDNFRITTLLEDGTCVSVSSDTLSYTYTNLICNRKQLDLKTKSSKKPFRGMIVKIVVPCVIGFIGIVSCVQLLLLWYKHQREKKEAEAAARANTETA